MSKDVIEIDDDVTAAITAEVSKGFDAKFEEQAKAFEDKLAEVTKKEEDTVVVDKGARAGEAATGLIVTGKLGGRWCC